MAFFGKTVTISDNLGEFYVETIEELDKYKDELEPIVAKLNISEKYKKLKIICGTKNS